MTFNAEKYITPTVRNIPPSGIRRFFDLVSQMKGVISLGVGEPDFVTPWHIREACVHTLEKGYTMYTSNYGTPELRKAISDYLVKRFDVEYDFTNELIVTVGASEAVDLAVRTILEPGDEVLIPEPCYVSYKPCVDLAGGVAVMLPTSAQNEFRITAEEIKKHISKRTKALILSYPNNPTGAVLTSKELLPIAALVKEHDLLVISDEIYAELTYEGKHTAFSALPGMKERTLLINGFSKAFAMTGWRVGYIAAHKDFIRHMVKIHQYNILCAPVMGQMAALEALQNGMPEVEHMRESYNQRRRLVVSRLEEIGLQVFEPKGAFYAFPSIKNTGFTSDEFAERLLEKEKVAVVPGNAFGESGEGFIRISYASSVANLDEAFKRIGRFLKSRD